MSGGSLAAIDLGASSGRVIVGRVADGALALDEVHRFPNDPVALPDGLHWDVVGLYRSILDGLRRAGASSGDLAGIGVDSWGVDYGLLDATGALVGLPFHYRDGRTDGLAAERRGRRAARIGCTRARAPSSCRSTRSTSCAPTRRRRGWPRPRRWR